MTTNLVDKLFSEYNEYFEDSVLEAIYKVHEEFSKTLGNAIKSKDIDMLFKIMHDADLKICFLEQDISMKYDTVLITAKSPQLDICLTINKPSKTIDTLKENYNNGRC